MNTQHLTNGTMGASDGDIFVTLKEHHHPTAKYVADLRNTLSPTFPDATFYMLPADITTQILNFGIPAPIDIQFEGNDVDASKEVADKMLSAASHRFPASLTCAFNSPSTIPTLQLNVDRTKASQGGYTQRDVSSSVLNTLSG